MSDLVINSLSSCSSIVREQCVMLHETVEKLLSGAVRQSLTPFTHTHPQTDTAVAKVTFLLKSIRPNYRNNWPLFNNSTWAAIQ